MSNKLIYLSVDPREAGIGSDMLAANMRIDFWSAFKTVSFILVDIEQKGPKFDPFVSSPHCKAILYGCRLFYF